MRRALLLGLALAVSGCSLPGRFMRGYAEADPEGMELLDEGGPFERAPAALRGQVRFVFDDFGSLSTDVLETYGVPWKLVVASVVLHRVRQQGAAHSPTTFYSMVEEYGFLRPTRIANWEGPQPRLDRPLGLIGGIASRGFPAVEIEIGNLGCAACHAAPLYGADGRPTGEAWLGLPNASIDVTGYADEVFAALRAELETPDTLLAEVRRLFPAVSDREISTLRKHVIPGAREELASRAEAYGGLVPFRNGGPGLNNGAGSLQFLFRAQDSDVLHRSAAWASAPELSGTSLRRAVLVDGVYGPPGSTRYGPLAADDVTDAHLGALAGVVSLFVVGTQGIEPERARDAIPRVHDVMRFVHELRPPPFPGHVDHALAAEGAEVYRQACASCHGTYSAGTRDVRLLEHPNRLVAQDRMRTDSVRWAAADARSLALLGRIGYTKVVEPVNGGGYVAPDLSGVWATAPYLHNGSVPTLWHLLHAEARPERFEVGGHPLDYDRVGIAGALDEDGAYRYPAGYHPTSRPMLYDTREPGRSNAGHDFGSLTEAERRAVLEYMKVL
jgi:mono/diheme cytochrome c family protein